MGVIDLDDSPIGTAHPKATCCWCRSPLVIGQVMQKRAWLCPVDYRKQTALALTSAMKAKKGTEPKCYNVPLPSQALLEMSTARNVLWGGMAGPGKSHGVRWWLYKRSLATPGHEALLLRENWDQLDKNHLRPMEREVEALGGRFWKSDRKVEFGTGSTASIIDCGHMADTDAIGRYIGTEYGAIVPDEASLYPLDNDGIPILAELSTRARKSYKDTEGRVVLPRFVPVTNPGGPSSAWLRDMFIDHTPDFEKFPKLKPVYDEQGVQVKGYRPEQWDFIPARLDDNPYMRDDYADTDLSILSGVRYQQLAEGDWNVFAGAFFQKWSPTLDGKPWHVRELFAS